MRIAARILPCGALGMLLWMAVAAGAQADPIKMRISLDSPAQHGKTIVMNNYVAALKAKVGNRLDIELFHSGQLFNDRDVSKAIRQGAVEMAAPGVWLLGGIDSNANFSSLPVFYGIELEQIRKAIDGEPGRELNKSLETKLNAKILGSWLEGGLAHWYSTNKPINSYQDIQGMTIRTPGGAANELRLKFFKANVVTIPYPDLALALSQGKADGFISAHDSVVAAKMWEAGVKHSFEDYQLAAHYIPMLNRAFWDKLSPDLQKILVDTWQEQVPAQRAAAAAAQAQARNTLIANGVKIVTPDSKTRAAARERMMQEYDQWVKAVKVDPDFAKKLLQTFR
ncbi:MAG: TRAP transporter substrate-binding protein DctP [Betaproteobacteria bacterium]|nr:MAG: TRAP transporter substrate-binding protein DctP [Betaproteobacteria bacterium]